MAAQEHRFAGIVPAESHQGNVNNMVRGNPAVLAAKATAQTMAMAEQMRFELTPSSSEWRTKHHRNTQMDEDQGDSQENKIEGDKDTEVLQETQVLPKEFECGKKTSQRTNAGSGQSLANKIIRVVGAGGKVFYRYKDICSLSGTVTENGLIFCSHCQEVLTPGNFQRHAGDKRKVPFLSSCFTVKDGAPVTLQELLNKGEDRIDLPSRMPLPNKVCQESSGLNSGTPIQTPKSKALTQRADSGKPTSILELLGSQNNLGGLQNIFAPQQPKRMLATAPNSRFSLSQPSPSRVDPYTPAGHAGAARVLFPPENKETMPPDDGTNAAMAEILQQLKKHWSEEKPEQVKRYELLSNVQKICSRLETETKMHQQQLESQLKGMEKEIKDKFAERDMEIATWLDVVESRLEGLQVICLNLPELIASILCDYEAQRKPEDEAKMKHAPCTLTKDQKCIGLFAEEEVAQMSEAVDPEDVNQEEVLFSLKTRIRKAKLAERIRGAQRAAFAKDNPFAVGTVKNAVYAILTPQSSMGQGLTLEQIEFAAKELQKLDRKVWPHKQKASRLRSILCKALKNDPYFYSHIRDGGKQRFFLRSHMRE